MITLTARSRYAAYAAAAVVAVSAYVWGGSESSQVSPAGKQAATQYGELPAVAFLDSAAKENARRNLFKFGQPEVAAVAPPPAPAPVVVKKAPEPVKVVEAPRPKPDLLAGIQVLGVVKTEKATNVLLKVGKALRTVAVGESFGAGNAIKVASVKSRYVKLTDASSNTSKTFALSVE